MTSAALSFNCLAHSFHHNYLKIQLLAEWKIFQESSVTVEEQLVLLGKNQISDRSAKASGRKWAFDTIAHMLLSQPALYNVCKW